MFMNLQVSLGTAGLHHAAINGDLRVFVLSLASQFYEEGCALLYKVLVGFWSSGQVASKNLHLVKVSAPVRCF